MRPSVFSSFPLLSEKKGLIPSILYGQRHLPREKLVGTVAPHSCYVLLHHPLPPSHLPSKPDSALLKALRQRVSAFGGLVNFAWREDIAARTKQSAEGPESYSATAFSVRGGRLDVPLITETNVDEVVEALKRHTSDEQLAPCDQPGDSTEGEVQLYVCTHGSRDCRCGETGGATLRALQDELRKLCMQSSLRTEWSISPENIRIGEVTHVGGHKYAANILIFPLGEWLGYIEPEHANLILQLILTHPLHHQTEGQKPPLLPGHWRGRMGLTAAQQEELLVRSAAPLPP